jgi:hypothetical protein
MAPRQGKRNSYTWRQANTKIKKKQHSFCFLFLSRIRRVLFFLFLKDLFSSTGGREDNFSHPPLMSTFNFNPPKGRSYIALNIQVNPFPCDFKGGKIGSLEC